MTVAVCLKCGEIKHGAFNPCHSCGYTPNDDESLTKHLLVTDHYLSQDELNEVSRRVRSGEEIQFDPQALADARVSAKELAKTERGCWIGCVTFFLAIIVICAISIWTIYF